MSAIIITNLEILVLCFQTTVMKSHVIPFIILLAGCASAKITSSWTAPSAGATNYKKIMVVSMIQNEDSIMRHKMEEHMTNDLRSLGYSAVSFNEQFQPGELKDMRYDSVRARLLNLGIDGVITINLLAKEKESVYVKDKYTPSSDNLPMGKFWESSTMTVRQDQGKPGYYVTATQYYWESKFYDVNALSLLYNANTTSFEASSAQAIAHKYGQKIVQDMQDKYVLSAKIKKLPDELFE